MEYWGEFWVGFAMDVDRTKSDKGAIKSTKIPIIKNLLRGILRTLSQISVD